jgi:putative hydrolase of the HAD superfamily
LLLGHPALSHDVSLARQRGIREALVQGAWSPGWRRQVFTGFMAERSKIEVSEATHALLARLAARYPLAVITNGNLDLEQAGLAGYFTLVCKAGAGAE